MNSYLRILFFVVITGMWGACAVLVLGILLGISDKLFGTSLAGLINIIISGGEIGRHKGLKSRGIEVKVSL